MPSKSENSTAFIYVAPIASLLFHRGIRPPTMRSCHEPTFPRYKFYFENADCDGWDTSAGWRMAESQRT